MPDDTAWKPVYLNSMYGATERLNNWRIKQMLNVCTGICVRVKYSQSLPREMKAVKDFEWYNTNNTFIYTDATHL